MATLVLAEHDNAELKPATLNVISAAGDLGGDVHVLVAGSGCQTVADAAAKVAGVSTGGAGNAARRAIVWGYGNVLWYPDGSDGWRDAGGELVTAEPVNFLGEGE